jgi:hypothetical protein
VRSNLTHGLTGADVPAKDLDGAGRGGRNE